MDNLNKYYKKAKNSTTDKIKQTTIQIKTIKNKFNMDISEGMQIILRSRIRAISITVGFLALISLLFMSKVFLYFMLSLVVGFIAMLLDFIIEYKGISNNSWDYPTTTISFRKVPIEVPLLFFGCGILATFLFYCFLGVHINAIMTNSVIVGFSLVQVGLFFTGIFFMIQYFLGKIKTLVFGTLPISIALYLSIMEPWILVISILPIYIDYYLEKRLVKSAHIKYDKYGEEVATNVAISYFPAALFIMSVIAIFLKILKG
jgi:hypothetical protein